MFRGKQSSVKSATQFGVGTVMSVSKREFWVVVESAADNNVALLNLNTFQLERACSVKVEDINFLSENEARQLISGLSCAFSDLEFDNKGLKFIKWREYDKI